MPPAAPDPAVRRIQDEVAIPRLREEEGILRAQMEMEAQALGAIRLDFRPAVGIGLVSSLVICFIALRDPMTWLTPLVWLPVGVGVIVFVMIIAVAKNTRDEHRNRQAGVFQEAQSRHQEAKARLDNALLRVGSLL